MRRRTGKPHHRTDGRWHIAVQRKGKRTYIYGATKAEVEAKYRASLPVIPVGGLTLKAFLESWIANARSGLRPTTQLSYEMTIDKHLVPALGSIPLAALTVDDVQGYVNASTLAPATIRRHLTVLHRALRAAEQRRLVTTNVASYVEVPSATRKEMKVLAAPEVRAFLTAMEDDKLYPLWLMAATLGMRRGELLGLRWGDVDTERGTLTIARTLIRLEGGFIFGEPKTANSRRTLALPANVLNALKRHRRPEDQDADLIFRRPNGGPIYGHRLTEQMKRVTGLRFHDLRHTSATNLLAMGASLDDVKRMLGHATIATTSDLYGHADLGRQRQLAAQLNAAYGVEVVSEPSI